jgi:glycosyltransferase involved in cell wall biosynthesis
MRVALDCGPLLDPPTGVGRYTRELAHGLETVGVDVARWAVALRGDAGDSIRRARFPTRAAEWVWRRFGRPPIDRLVGEVDVVHGTNFTLPALGRPPGVVTVHDLSYLRSDVWPGGERLRDLVPWSIGRAAAVLAPSRVVADEIAENYPDSSGRLYVTPEGVAPEFFGATPLGETVLGRLGIPGRFVLTVGTIEPRKNLPRLLDAWRRSDLSNGGWTLVVAGPRGWGEDLPKTAGVRLLGRVEDETLPGLMAAADLFCYPSLYEGFGLPPLEAMAAGTATLAGAYPAAAEVLGEAAVIVQSRDSDALGGELVRLAGDQELRASLGRAGRVRAAGFTWERTALATRRAYEEAIG